MSRPTLPAERIQKTRTPKKLCVISTEDSKYGAYEYLGKIRSEYSDKFIVHISTIVGSERGRTSPKHVLNRLKPHGFDPNYDTCWVVCDVDSWGEKKLGEVAAECAKTKGFRTAISNNCFEIWILYHKQGFNSAYVNSAECKKAGVGILEKLGGYEALFQEHCMKTAIEKAKQMDANGDDWPKTQGSHMYKLIEYLRS